MTRSYAACLWIVLAAGCGPFDRTMPPRLDAETQKGIDTAWDTALTPVGKYDRERWLDTLVGVHAYQVGVDSLTFRSEKAFSGGRVVMEVSFDRSRPGDDRFVLSVLDPAGTVVRREVYTRAEVESAAQELFDPARNRPADPGDPPEVVRQKLTAGERWKLIQEMLPKPKEPGK